MAVKNLLQRPLVIVILVLVITTLLSINLQNKLSEALLSSYYNNISTQSSSLNGTSNNDRNQREAQEPIQSHSVSFLDHLYIKHHTDEYAIPNVLIFTHRYNLLKTEFDFHNKTKDELTKHELSLLSVQQNVHHIISLHPDAMVRFLDDDDCRNSIYTVMMKIYNNNQDKADEMIKYFNNENAGMFQGDICRGFALYETGGLYFDVDLGIYGSNSLWNHINTTTEFATIMCEYDDTDPNSIPSGFFQAFIGSTKKNIVIERYIELFYQYYKGTLPNIDKVNGGFLGVILLHRAYNEIQAQQKRANQALLSGRVDVTTHLQQTSQIWHERNHDERLMKYKTIPFPHWADPKSPCQVIVATKLYPINQIAKLQQQGKNLSLVEIQKLESDEQEIFRSIDIIFYSHIAHTERCPRR